jgi:hypothetical protein
MSAELAQHIRHIAQSGARVHIWPCEAGFQANIAEPGTNSWTVHTRPDPIDALVGALRQFVTRLPDRRVEGIEEPDTQVAPEDDEAEVRRKYNLAMAEMRAAAAPPADDFEDLF